MPRRTRTHGHNLGEKGHAMLTTERATQLREAIARLRAAGRNPSYHAIHSVVRGKYATLCEDLRELAACEAQGTIDPDVDTGGAALATAGAPADPPTCWTPQAQLVEAEARLIAATAERAAATAEAAQWTQDYLSIEPRLRLGTLAAQDPSIALTREAFAQARTRYQAAWAEEAAAAEAARQAGRRAWVARQDPELCADLAQAEAALAALVEASLRSLNPDRYDAECRRQHSIDSVG